MTEPNNIPMNITKAAKYLGVGRTKFYELLKIGEFPNAYKVGDSTVIPLFDLMAYRKRNLVEFDEMELEKPTKSKTRKK